MLTCCPLIYAERLVPRGCDEASARGIPSSLNAVLGVRLSGAEDIALLCIQDADAPVHSAYQKLCTLAIPAWSVLTHHMKAELHPLLE